MPEELQTVAPTEWKPLLICPNDSLRGEIRAAVSDTLPLMECSAGTQYPALKAVLSAVLKQERNICFLDVGTDEDAAIQILSELAEAAVPVIAVHTSNDSDLILRCL